MIAARAVEAGRRRPGSTGTRAAAPCIAAAALCVAATLAACGDEGPFAVEVVDFSPGDGAGFGQDRMPGVVLGPPHGAGETQGSTDVVSLGTGGSITLRMGREIDDGDGADLIVFENAFKAATGALFAEPGEVAVSDDGARFVAFACAPGDPAPNGCAGLAPVLADGTDGTDGTDGVGVDATNPAVAGGDAFDLADIGVARARFVRISDRGSGGAPPSAGFDLDAVAVATHEAPP